MNTNMFIDGGNTTTERLIVELVFLAVSAIAGSYLTFLINNPGLFPGQWMLIIRLVLGAIVNFANSKLPNQ